MDMRPYSGAAFIKVADVKDNGPIRVVITGIQIGEYGKPDLSFDDGTKLSLNATNNKALCQAYGVESDDWIGKEIELVLGEVDFKGKPHEAVLVEPVSPPIARRPPPKPRKGSGDDMDDEIAF